MGSLIFSGFAFIIKIIEGLAIGATLIILNIALLRAAEVENNKAFIVVMVAIIGVLIGGGFIMGEITLNNISFHYGRIVILQIGLLMFALMIKLWTIIRNREIKKRSI